MKHDDTGLDIRKHIVETRCRKCNKIFVPAPFHVFKDNRGYYCSYTCYNHRERPQDRRYRRRVNQYTLDGVLVNTYPSATKAAENVGAEPYRIVKACRGELVYKKYLWRYEDDEK